MTTPKCRAEHDLALQPLATRTVKRAVAAMVTVVLLTAGVLVWSPWGELQGDAAARTAHDRDAALDAGTTALVAFNTIDYREIGSITKSWLAASTGTLAEQVRASRKAVAERSKKDRTRSRAEVLESAVTAYDGSAGTASVIALVSMHTEKDGQKPVTNRSRFQVALQRIDSAWKVSHLEALEAER